MSVQPPNDRRPLVPLLLLHLAAAAICFGFFTVVPIIGCVILKAIGSEPGGPMFFPIFVMGVVLSAVAITLTLAGTALLSDLLRRHHRVALWLPPLIVLAVTTGTCALVFSRLHPAVPFLVGGLVALAFIVHWSAISAVWFLSRRLVRRFRFQHASPSS